jgi:RimJ/RimL family protein N-acetyltransferase
MNLVPLDDVTIPMVASWLGRKENYQWLDFGNGKQSLDAVILRLMIHRPVHHLRLFAAGNPATPIGIVAFSQIDPNFGVAQLWYVLGDRTYAGRGYTSAAVSAMLDYGFRVLHLESVNAWAVASNTPSIRVLEKNHFRLIGTQRRCHRLDGMSVDRLLFDLVASEYQPLPAPDTEAPIPTQGKK